MSRTLSIFLSSLLLLLAGIFPASGNIVHALDKVGNRSTTFSYDANGNRTLKQVGGITTQSYSFDCENRLIGLTDGTGTYGYTYDHRTRRVGRNESAAGGVNSELSFAGGLSVQEYTSGSSLPNVETIRGSDYGGGIGGVLYTIRSGARSYNAYNSRGDVVSKTDDGGAITWQSSYEAFGTRTQEQGSTQDRQKANTKDEDPTGLLNEGMRYRDLEFGAFLTRDPAGFVDGPNVYTYLRQNPWTMFDPLGLESSHEKKWKSIAADENEGAAKRIGASFMAAGEALNPFRSDSSLRDGGRDLQKGMAEGREKMKAAPPVVREIGQFTMGVGSAGTALLSVPAAAGELGDSVQQVGFGQTAKNMATGFVDHAMNNPVEFAGEAMVAWATGKAMAGSGPTESPSGASARQTATGPKCFAAGTDVQTLQGEKDIESIEVGDIVYAYDFETGKVVEKRVLETVSNFTHYWADVEIDGEVLSATRGHKFWVESAQEWIEAAELKPGMLVRLSDGRSYPVSKVNIRPLPTPETTYNLIVEDEHNYFVGTHHVLVHNGYPESPQYPPPTKVGETFQFNFDTSPSFRNSRVAGVREARALGIIGEGQIGHHINSVQTHPHLAAEPSNIAPEATRASHLETHGGNWKNPTSGPLNGACPKPCLNLSLIG